MPPAAGPAPTSPPERGLAGPQQISLTAARDQQPARRFSIVPPQRPHTRFIRGAVTGRIR